MFMKKINYERGGGVEAAGCCFKGNQQGLTKMKEGDKKLRVSMWWTVTGESRTNQEAGMTGQQWVRVRRVRLERYWQLP